MRKSNGLPSVMHYNDKTAKTDEEKANLFAECFENVYCEHDVDDTLEDFILNRNDDNCHNFLVTENHIKAVLSRMDLHWLTVALMVSLQSS